METYGTVEEKHIGCWAHLYKEIQRYTTEAEPEHEDPVFCVGQNEQGVALWCMACGTIMECFGAYYTHIAVYQVGQGLVFTQDGWAP